jgi:hypothetical protein
MSRVKDYYLIERAGCDLRVYFSATPGDPGQTSGPPERCWPPEPPEVDIECIELQVGVTDDLSSDAQATRPVWVDVTDLLLEVGGNSFVNSVTDEVLERLNDDDWGQDDEGPDSYGAE